MLGSLALASEVAGAHGPLPPQPTQSGRGLTRDSAPSPALGDSEPQSGCPQTVDGIPAIGVRRFHTHTHTRPRNPKVWPLLKRWMLGTTGPACPLAAVRREGAVAGSFGWILGVWSCTVPHAPYPTGPCRQWTLSPSEPGCHCPRSRAVITERSAGNPQTRSDGCWRQSLCVWGHFPRQSQGLWPAGRTAT